ncbi:ribonuclease H-like domain-containing protein [Tanacetum coccineum]
MSTAEPKNIKEAMADHIWIQAMQEELHQFDRLKVWELVDKSFGKTMINLKWLWKNKKDRENTVIRIKARIVAKGYRQKEEDMDQDSAHMVAASKVPMLKPGEFELWRMRIEQYIQMIDYALWEVIENVLLEAIEKRFGRNEDTKKSQRNLSKQQYENFTTLSSEMLDQTLIGFQSCELVDLLGEKLSQERCYHKVIKKLSH